MQQFTGDNVPAAGSEVRMPVAPTPGPSVPLQGNGLQGALAAPNLPGYNQGNSQPPILPQNGMAADSAGPSHGCYPMNPQNLEMSSNYFEIKTEEDFVEAYLSNVPNFSELGKDKRHRLKCNAKNEYYKNYLCLKQKELIKLLLKENSKLTCDNGQLKSAIDVLRSENEMLRQESFQRWLNDMRADERWVDELPASPVI